MNEKRLSDKYIEDCFYGTKFGGSEKTNIGRRGLMSECILKKSAGYGDGHTIITICKESGLLKQNGDPSKVGLRWAFDQLYKSSSKSILERIHERESFCILTEIASAISKQCPMALFNVLSERTRQEKKWGVQNHDPFIWLAILTEEVGEFSEAILENKFGDGGSNEISEELIQVAAVALSMVECCMRNRWGVK